MKTRAYVFLDIKEGAADRAVRVLEGMAGVIMADRLEGNPDVILVVEASSREALAKLTVQAMTEIESITCGLRLLPAQVN